MKKTTTLRIALKSVKQDGDRFTVMVGGQIMSAKSKQDAKRRAYKHARNLRIAKAS